MIRRGIGPFISESGVFWTLDGNVVFQTLLLLEGPVYPLLDRRERLLSNIE